MTISYRYATADDVDKIAELTVIAAGGISEFMLDGLFPKTSAQELLKLAILNEKNPMYYANTLVAEQEGGVIAATNFYPAKEHGVPALMKAFIPPERINHMKNFYESRVDNSLYVHTMSVLPEYRHTSAAMDLMKALKKIAFEKKLKFLSAHVWADNKPVVMALKLAQFEVIENIAVARHELLPHDGGMLLMKSQELASV